MQPYTPFYSPFVPGFMSIFIPIVLVVALWTIIIKGYALWTAARAGHRNWFIALLVINTVGILELVYLFKFSPKGSNKFNKSSHTPAAPSSTPQA